MARRERDHDDTTLARISSLETSVTALTDDVRRVLDRVDRVVSGMSEAAAPQYGNIISGVGLAVIIIGAIGAAFISPLTMQLNGHERLLSARGQVIEDIQDRVRSVEVRVESNSESHIVETGAIKEKLNEVAKHGSGLARERLAVLEYKLGLTTTPRGPAD